VFYRSVAASDTDQAFAVLKDNKVAVRSTVTKTMMNELTANTYPTLTVTAYASQLYKNNTTQFTAAEAWTNVAP
jgi:protein-disulfide isomerase-like protein with CxxC motif